MRHMQVVGQSRLSDDQPRWKAACSHARADKPTSQPCWAQVRKADRHSDASAQPRGKRALNGGSYSLAAGYSSPDVVSNAL